MAPSGSPHNAKRLNHFLSPPTVWVERQVGGLNLMENVLVDGGFRAMLEWAGRP